MGLKEIVTRLSAPWQRAAEKQIAASQTGAEWPAKAAGTSDFDGEHLGEYVQLPKDFRTKGASPACMRQPRDF